MFKTFFLYALAFTVFVSGFSVLLPVSDAKAASIYDDVITVQDELIVKRQLTQYCSPDKVNQNWTNSWSEVFSSLNGTASNGEQFAWRQGSVSKFPEVKTSWDFEKQKWGVSVWAAEGGVADTVLIWWSEDPNATATFGGSGGYKFLGVNSGMSYKHGYITATINDGYNCELSIIDAQYGTSGSIGYIPIAQKYNQSADYIFFAYVTIVYPPDYQGEIAPETGGNPPGVNYAPQIGWHLDDTNTIKALTIKPDECLPVGLNEQTACLPPKLKWQILEMDGTTELYSEITDLQAPFSYKFPAFERFIFQITYVAPGPPAAPIRPDVILVPTKFEVNANGQFIIGGTGVQDCAVVSGTNDCGEPDPLEDCSTYDTIVTIFDTEFPIISAEGIACNLRNFGTWLRNLVIDLFVPSTRTIAKYFSDFQTSIQNQFGFLFSGLTMLIQWINSLLVVTPNCRVDLGGTFFSAPISINFCYFEESAPTIWNPMATTFRLLMAAAFVFIAYRRLIEIVRGLGQ